MLFRGSGKKINLKEKKKNQTKNSMNNLVETNCDTGS